MDCTCEDWKESQPQIQSAQILADVHGQEYYGKPYRFCPWCGLTLHAGDALPRPEQLPISEELLISGVDPLPSARA